MPGFFDSLANKYEEYFSTLLSSLSKASMFLKPWCYNWHVHLCVLKEQAREGEGPRAQCHVCC